MSIELKDKLYTSTQVAEILGVSLRTLYRYMEDGRIKSMRTASGRHRFTKDQILEFLNAGNMGATLSSQPSQPVSTSQTNQGVQPGQFRAGTQTSPVQPGVQSQSEGGMTPPLSNVQSSPSTTPFQNDALDTTETSFAGQMPGTTNADYTGVPPVTDTKDSGSEFASPTSGKQSISNSDEPFFSSRVSPVDITGADESSQSATASAEVPTGWGAQSQGRQSQQTQQRASDQPRSKPVRDRDAPPFSKASPIQPIVTQTSTSTQVQAPVRESSESRDSNAGSQVPTQSTGVQAEQQLEPNVSDIAEGIDLNLEINIRYYKSDYTDLMELAKKIKDTAVAKDLEYAFTLYAGLSLHYLIKPFTILHFYANPEDLQIWKGELRLMPAVNKKEANIGIIVNTDIVFVPSKEIGGFKVVEDKVLLKDLSNSHEDELFKDFRARLTSSR